MAVTDADNPYFYSTLSGTPTTQITDSVDFPHSGLIRALSQGVRGNYAVKTANDFDITFGAATHSTIAATAGKVYRDGKLHTVDALSALPLNTSYNPGTGAVSLIPISAGDVYLILVAKDGGSSNDTMVLRGSNGTHSVVPALVEGDVPIAIIKITAGSANGSAQQADRMVQYLTTGKVESSLSVGYDSSGYTETLAIESSSGDTNIIASVADKDINFKGTDGSSDITALQLDMALAGKATFSGAIESAGTVTATGFTIGSAAITEAELEIIDGATITTAELNMLASIGTDTVATQLGTKADKVGSNNFTSKQSIILTKNDTTAATTSLPLTVGIARTGAVNTGTDTQSAITVNSSVTGASGGTITNTGLDVNVTGDAGGTSIGKGIDIITTGSDTQTGLLVQTENTKGTDIKIVSSADTGDFFSITTTTHGATTIATVDDDANDDADLTIDVDGKIVIEAKAGDEVVFNEAGLDVDFRVESNDSASMLFVNGGDNRVGIGTGSPATTLDIGGNAQITNPDGINATAFKIDNADAGEIALEIIAANTETDVIDITADTVTTANVIDITADGLTDGSALNIISDSASTATRNIAYIKNDHASAVNTTVLKLESDANSGAPALHVKAAGSGDHLILEGTLGSAATSAPNLVLFRNGADSAADIDDNDLIGQIVFRGENDNNTPQEVNYATIEGGMDDTTDGSEDGHITFNLMEAGTLSEYIRIRAATRDVVINEQADDIDFRCEGSSDVNLLFVDADTDRVGIGTATPANKLQVSHTGADGNNGLMIVREDSAVSDGELLGGIGFDSTDTSTPSSVLESSAFISAFATQSHGPNSKGGTLKLGVSLIDEADDTVSTVLASVGPPDTLANAACHAGFNSRATTAIVAAATYAPTIGDSGTLVIFNHANSNLTLPSINNTTSVGVQFTVFNETGSAIESQIATSNSATINGASAGAPNDDIDFLQGRYICL